MFYVDLYNLYIYCLIEMRLRQEDIYITVQF